MENNTLPPFYKISVIAFIIIVIVFFQSKSFGQELSEAQKEIWKMEEKFWSSWKEKTGTSLPAFHHKNAIIWASDTAMPHDRGETGPAAGDGIGELIESFELAPQEIRSFGNVAVVQYYAKVIYAGKPFIFRIFHTWIKQDGKWIIIGAMHDSCSKLPHCLY